jgi:hypothetical protein
LQFWENGIRGKTDSLRQFFTSNALLPLEVNNFTHCLVQDWPAFFKI